MKMGRFILSATKGEEYYRRTASPAACPDYTTRVYFSRNGGETVEDVSYSYKS
jgi:hypothetical protein